VFYCFSVFFFFSILFVLCITAAPRVRIKILISDVPSQWEGQNFDLCLYSRIVCYCIVDGLHILVGWYIIYDCYRPYDTAC